MSVPTSKVLIRKLWLPSREGGLQARLKDERASVESVEGARRHRREERAGVVPRGRYRGRGETARPPPGAPPLRVVVLDRDATLEEISRRRAVFPVEVGLYSVISNRMLGEYFDAPVDGEEAEGGVGDPLGPAIRRAGRPRFRLRSCPLLRPLRSAPAAAGGGRHQKVRPTASAISRIWPASAANCSG
jgi:hypothetical protein